MAKGILKIKSRFCENPFATSLALYRATEPSKFLFILNSHLHPTGIPPRGEVRHHVLLRDRTFISSFTTLA